MTPRSVHLGFEIGSGAPVEIPVSHMAVFGQTQKSGKTTALEALITRAKIPAIAFLTKRGEGGFQNARKILPYFKENADWHFVQTILESVMRQDQKFKQPWIIRACEGAKTLADVQKRATKLEKAATNSMSQDMYMVLGEYLKKVIPIISQLPKTNTVHLSPGLSVMDLIAYPFELQILVIASTLDWIYEHAEGVITVIPEAWKFVPERRNTPVKVVAEKLVREGAGLKNFVWIDSQDMAGVDKLQLRACSTWLVGVQREANEVKRALANMEGKKKPKAADVVTLRLGQFFACFDDQVHKTYVQPAWLDNTAASQIATGRLSVQDVMPLPPIDAMRRELNRYEKEHDELPPHSTEEKEAASAQDAVPEVAGEFPPGSLQDPGVTDSPVVVQTSAESEETSMADSAELACKLNEILFQAKKALDSGNPDLAQRMVTAYVQNKSIPSRTETGGEEKRLPQPANQQSLSAKPPASAGEWLLTEQLYSQILDRLVQDVPKHPSILQLLALRPEIVVTVKKQTVELDGSSLRGRLAILLSENFFEDPTTGNAAWKELDKRGTGSAKPNVYRELDKLTEMGFLVKVDGGYQSVPGMKVSKNRVEAAA